ncbi:MAG: hypothetical protein KGL39_57765, partial [Patescibacteria group bacterium]|nr:hypothetical protein [Patescibacteria group bacterium]
MKPQRLSRTERTILALLVIGAVAICVNGCSQLDQQTAVANAQKTLAATTQAVDQAQQAITDFQKQIAHEQQLIRDEQAVLTTQPSDPTATKALAATEAALEASQKALGQATDYVTKAKPAIDSLNAALAAIQNGQTPNFAPLGALGPYGTIAAVVLTLGYGAWQKYQNVK